MKKIMTYAVATFISLMSFHGAQATETSVGKTTEQASKTSKIKNLLRLQTELSSLEGQIEDLENQIAQDSKIRTVSLVLSAGFMLIAGKAIKKSNANVELGEAIFHTFLGIGAGVAAVGSGGTGAYKHYQVNVNSEELVAMKEKLKRIQSKLAQAIEENSK